MKHRPPVEPSMLRQHLLLFLPAYVVGIAVVFVGSVLASIPDDASGQMKVHAFGKIPIVEGGRPKPIDTMARTNLLLISRRQFFVDDQGITRPAIEWLLDVLSGKGDRHQVFYIENDQVLDFLGLEARKGFRYSFAEVQRKRGALQDKVDRIQEMEAGQAGLFEGKIMELARRVKLYDQMRFLLDLGNLAELRQNPQKMRQFIALLIQDKEKNLAPHLVRLPDGEWETFHLAAILAIEARQRIIPVQAFYTLDRAYAEADVYGFNSNLEEYERWLTKELPDETRLAGFEVFCNAFEPFARCWVLYTIVGLLTCAAWVALPLAGRDWMDALNRSAFWLAVFTLFIHTFGILARMYLTGRPPVTNLYSSAVFIGWCAVGVGLILERTFRIGIGNVVIAVVGYVTTMLANHLALGGDTLEMLQAVLDTNFWLWTHVTCVTFGYSATFVAGVVGIVFICLGVFTPLLTREWMKVLGQVMYGIICFATFLSFTGTVLGGIWADQSWGRFWGWDPKENGALLIVIWNALILHARWCGLVKTRGMAVLAIVGNMITAWSWFGTNQLGVGLHAYGFSKELAEGCRWFWLSQLALLGIGLVPTDRWRSFGRESLLPKPDKKKPRDRKDDGGNGQPAPKGEIDTAIKAAEPAGV